VRTEIRDEMEEAGLEGRIGVAGIYLEVDDGVQDLEHGPPAEDQDV
jgi:hypothetical protein